MVVVGVGVMREGSGGWREKKERRGRWGEEGEEKKKSVTSAHGLRPRQLMRRAQGVCPLAGDGETHRYAHKL